MTTQIYKESIAHNTAMRGGMGAVTAVSRVSQVVWFTNYDDAVAFAREWFAADAEMHAFPQTVELTDYYTGEVLQTIDH